MPQKEPGRKLKVEDDETRIKKKDLDQVVYTINAALLALHSPFAFHKP
jgi:hypothetical protein